MCQINLAGKLQFFSANCIPQSLITIPYLADVFKQHITLALQIYLQWFSKDKRTGYSDVAKAVSRIA